MKMDLLVMYSLDVEYTRCFLGRLGMNFVCEQHNDGPVHYSSDSLGFTLEVYPTMKNPSRVRLQIEMERDLSEIVSTFSADEIKSADLPNGVVLRDKYGSQFSLVRYLTRKS